MTGTHGPHLTDPAGRLRAVTSDLEYYRSKRLEPRIFNLARRGVLRLPELLRSAGRLPAELEGRSRGLELEARLRSLEDRLDRFVTGVAAVMVPVRSANVTIDDLRKERGDYDPFFRIAKHEYLGSIEEQLSQLDERMAEAEHLLHVFTDALHATGEVTPQQLEQRLQSLTSQGFRNGARIVARAWVDPEFKQRLLADGREAVRELEVPPGRLGKLGIAENTEHEHNVVVCTLCSCYPSDLLGDPPWWYRTDEYRQRIVEDPRSMLQTMFGFEVEPDRGITVRDSTSDVRWMVLPRRPEGADGLSEEELAQLVTPEALVGVAEPRPASFLVAQ